MKAREKREAQPSPAPEQVRAEVVRLAALPEIAASPQLVAMLRYIVEATLADRQESLKGYVIGTEVFGRPAHFDPQADPIVRVQAKRLRDMLERHYQTCSQQDGVAIRLQKGSYVPTFAFVGAGPEEPTKERWKKPAWLGLLAALAVCLFAAAGAYYLSLSGPLKDHVSARGPSAKKEATSGGVDKLQYLAILHRPVVRLDLLSSSPDAARLLDQVLDAGKRFDMVRLKAMGSAPSSGFEILPDTHVYEIRVFPCQKCVNSGWSVHITSITRNEVIHIQDFETPSELGVDLGARMMKMALSMDGPIFIHLRQNERDVNEAFACANSTFSYFQTQKADLRQRIRDCLDRYRQTMIEDPIMEHVQALMYIDAHWRGDSTYGTIDLAIMSARRAVELGPFSSRFNYVLSLALGTKGEFQDALNAAERAYLLNPHDDLIAVGLAGRLMGVGRYDQARELLDRARRESPIAPAWVMFNLATAHVMLGEYGKLLPLVPALRTNPTPLGQVLWLIAESQRIEGEELWDILEKAGLNGPDASEKAVRAIASYYPNPEIRRVLGQEFAKTLRLAGWPAR